MNLRGPAWFLCAILVLLYCSETTFTGNGGSSETVNAQLIITDTTVTATVDKNEDVELSMRMYSTDYRPFEKHGFADSLTPADANKFRWQAPIAGNYNFLLTGGAKRVACFVRNISLKSGAVDTVECILEPEQVLSGTIVRSDTATDAGSYIVAILGSPFFGISDTTGSFTISDVPPCNYAINIRSTAKRLFVASASYSITAEMFDQSTRLQMMVP